MPQHRDTAVFINKTGLMTNTNRNAKRSKVVTLHFYVSDTADPKLRKEMRVGR